jgi:hypothetical protein
MTMFFLPVFATEVSLDCAKKVRPSTPDDSPHPLARFPRRFSSRLWEGEATAPHTESRPPRSRTHERRARVDSSRRKHRRAQKRVRGPHAHARVAGVIASPADTKSVVVRPTPRRKAP